MSGWGRVPTRQGAHKLQVEGVAKARFYSYLLWISGEFAQLTAWGNVQASWQVVGLPMRFLLLFWRVRLSDTFNSQQISSRMGGLDLPVGDFVYQARLFRVEVQNILQCPKLFRFDAWLVFC